MQFRVSVPHLQQEAELRAIAFAKAATARHHTRAAQVLRPVAIDRAFSLLVSRAEGAQHREAAVERRGAERVAQGGPPCVGKLLAYLKLSFV